MADAFADIPKIQYEGPKSKNPLAFKHYNPDEIVEGKTMRDQLRFSVTYWHTFRGMGADMFGVGTAIRPWDDGSQSVQNAQNRARVAFQFMEKLGVPFYAFHDRDVAPEGATLAESNRNLAAVGNRVPVCSSALHAWRRDELQCRCVRFRRRPGEEGARSDARTQR